MTRSVYIAMAIALGVAASSNAQRLNIDLGVAAGGAAGNYRGRAASGQGGAWNHINVAGTGQIPGGREFPLVNADGNNTGVTLTNLIDGESFEFVGNPDLLVDVDLLGDFHWNFPEQPAIYELRGVEPGEYSLFVYSYASDQVNDDTVITYNGESQTVAHIGASDPTTHGFLDTFALFFPVVPDKDGTISFDVQAGPGIVGIGNFWQINGLQLSIGNPSLLPPSLLLFQPVRGTDIVGCCTFDWSLRNINPTIAMTDWCMEIEAGLGGRSIFCIESDSVTIDAKGWTTDFCYPWDLGTGISAPSSRAVICFSGPPLSPGDRLGGTLRVEVNGEVSFDDPPPPPIELPYDPPGNEVVPSRGILISVNQGPRDTPCETGIYNSHNGLSEGWTESIEVHCRPEFIPVPTLSSAARIFLICLIAGGGMTLLRRSKQATVANQS